MIAKILTAIYVEVGDEEEGEEAAAAIQHGLRLQMESFPHGEVVGVNVERAMDATAEEIAEHGLEEA